MLPKVSEETAPVSPLIQGSLPCAGNGPHWVSLWPLQSGLSWLLISAEQGTQSCLLRAAHMAGPCPSLLTRKMSEFVSLSRVHTSTLQFARRPVHAPPSSRLHSQTQRCLGGQRAQKIQSPSHTLQT